MVMYICNKHRGFCDDRDLSLMVLDSQILVVGIGRDSEDIQNGGSYKDCS